MSILKRKNKSNMSEQHWLESQAAIFHEHTKYSELELSKKTPRIVEYMSSPRYILETTRNFKEYLKEKSISLAKPQTQKVDFYAIDINELSYQKKSNIVN